MSEPASLDFRFSVAADNQRLDDGDSMEAVYQQLRAAILNCEIPVATPLSQVQLARKLGVSRTPLREAIRLLQREGLIEASPNQRVRVAGFSVEDLDQLYAMRISLEALGVRMTVPYMNTADMQQLEDCLARMDELTEIEEYDCWNVPHRTYHALLVAGAGKRLCKQIEQLSGHAERYRRFYTAQTSGAWLAGLFEHSTIFEACKARHPAAAAEQLGRHYSTVALRVIATVAPEYDPVAIRTALRMVLQGN
ncbi:MAG TPA: GntR family transcriptional regulator [Ktedonobacteraceae bacterium]|nr:GntR family transcriptional regulator [Ktedonobacteraceae bacterium]